MIKRRNKRILAILAIFFLVLAMLACGLGDNPPYPSTEMAVWSGVTEEAGQNISETD
jgi:hypothetical protein